MNRRNSSVQHLQVINVGSTGVIEIGDTVELAPSIWTNAIQREKAIFFDNELDYADYPMFYEEIPQPYIDEQLELATVNKSSTIQVGQVDLLSIVASAVLQIGSGETIAAESRTKNIRHLLHEEYQT